MEKLKKLIYSVCYLPENLIYSVKYLPQILYFGSIGILFYAFFIVGGENLEAVVGKTIADYLNLTTTAPSIIIWFLYINHLGMKNNNTKREFGGKGCWKRYSST